MSGDCPCLCGHPLHWGQDCPTCKCDRASPDYLAGAKSVGPVSHARLLELQAATTSLSRQLRYLGPPAAGRTTRAHRVSMECRYCLGWFEARRGHARTCSGACREATSAALSRECDADVPSPCLREDSYSEERRCATGYGTVTATEAYRHDLRVREEAVRCRDLRRPRSTARRA